MVGFSIPQLVCDLVRRSGAVEYAEFLDDVVLVGDGLAGEGEAVAIHKQYRALAGGKPLVVLVHTL